MAEPRLIDANEAKRRIIAFATGCHAEVLTVDSIIMLLNHSDTVDAVEVVRCEKCKSCKISGAVGREIYYCTNPKGLAGVVRAEQYCSEGERKEEE